MSKSKLARRRPRTPYAWLGAGALGVGVWAAMAGGVGWPMLRALRRTRPSPGSVGRGASATANSGVARGPSRVAAGRVARQAPVSSVRASAVVSDSPRSAAVAAVANRVRRDLGDVPRSASTVAAISDHGGPMTAPVAAVVASATAAVTANPITDFIRIFIGSGTADNPERRHPARRRLHLHPIRGCLPERSVQRRQRRHDRQRRWRLRRRRWRVGGLVRHRRQRRCRARGGRPGRQRRCGRIVQRFRRCRRCRWHRRGRRRGRQWWCRWPAGDVEPDRERGRRRTRWRGRRWSRRWCGRSRWCRWRCRSDRTHWGDWGDRADRGYRSGRTDRADRADRSDRSDRADRFDRSDRADRGGRADRCHGCRCRGPYSDHRQRTG